MVSKKIQIHPYIYIPFTLGFSWLSWFLAISTGRGIENPAVKVFFLAGLLVPALTALAFILLSEDAEYHWDYWRRVFDPTLINRKAYLVIFLLPLLITIAAILISLFFGQPISQLKVTAQVRAHIPSVLMFIFYTFFVGPFPEELGWRGYWLDKLKGISSGLRASLLIGLVWALWQIPLFMIKGSLLQAKSSNLLLVIFILLRIFPLSVIFTYIFYKNKKSTLSTILFHFAINFFNLLFELKPLTEGIQTLLYLIVAFYLVGRNKEIFK